MRMRYCLAVLALALTACGHRPEYNPIYSNMVFFMNDPRDMAQLDGCFEVAENYMYRPNHLDPSKVAVWNADAQAWDASAWVERCAYGTDHPKSGDGYGIMLTTGNVRQN